MGFYTSMIDMWINVDYFYVRGGVGLIVIGEHEITS